MSAPDQILEIETPVLTVDPVRTERRTLRIRDLQRIVRRYSGLLSVVLLIGLGSKVLGFIREVYISSHFGVSLITDSYFGVQQLPVMAMNYMAGAFTLAFVPHYVAVKAQGRERRFVKTLLIWLGLICGVATLAMIVGARNFIPNALGTIAGRQLTAKFTVILATAILPSALLGVGYSVYHAERQHTKAMLLGAVPPAGMLMSLLVWSWWSANLQYALPWSYVIGSLVGGVWAIKRLLAVFRSSEKPPVVSNEPPPSGLKFVQQLSAASVENVAFNLNQLLTVHFAASTGAGAVALNAYALRIAMLPLSGIVIPVNQMVSTWLAKQDVSQQKHAFGKMLLVAASAFSLCGLAMFLLREPIIQAVYQRGAFSAENTVSVMQALAPYAIYFFVVAMSQLFARFYFVTGKGHVYTGVLLAGYAIGNMLKPFGAARFHLPGVISAATMGEGLALLALTMLFWRYRVKGYA